MIKVLLLSTFFIFAYAFRCGHDHFDDRHEKVFLNDLTDSRFLQTTQNGRYICGYSGFEFLWTTLNWLKEPLLK